MAFWKEVFCIGVNGADRVKVGGSVLSSVGVEVV